MNILPPIERHQGGWPIICCAWCGDDLNANNTLGLFDARTHFAKCALFLSSEHGHYWASTIEGQRYMDGARQSVKL